MDCTLGGNDKANMANSTKVIIDILVCHRHPGRAHPPGFAPSSAAPGWEAVQSAASSTPTSCGRCPISSSPADRCAHPGQRQPRPHDHGPGIAAGTADGRWGGHERRPRGPGRPDPISCREPTMKPTRCAMAIALTAAVISLPGCAAGATAGQSTSSPPPVPANAPALEQAYISVVAKVLPSVVQITTDRSLGSGVVFDTKGDIVTNAHVVGQATKFQVRLADSPKTMPATLVGA